jgi:hypothetical protein
MIRFDSSYSLIWLVFLLTVGRLMLSKSKAHLCRMTLRGSSLCISMDFFYIVNPSVAVQVGMN